MKRNTKEWYGILLHSFVCPQYSYPYSSSVFLYLMCVENIVKIMQDLLFVYGILL